MMNMKPSDKYDSLIQYYSGMFMLPWERVKAQMLAESSGNPSAKSSVGAEGLMQLMPGTAWELGVKNRTNPEESLRGGCQYMAKILLAIKGVLPAGKVSVSEEDMYRFTLVSYNAGYAYVRRALRLLLDEGLPVTWAYFVQTLPRARVNGRVARAQEACRYAERVLPLDSLLT
jgi:membrane-bound lytic murein transglycosylase F